MSEDRDPDSQTEDATEKKLQEAAARGDVPHSQEAPLFAALAAMLIAFIYLIPSRLKALSLDLQAFIDNLEGWRIATERDLLSLAAPVFLSMSRFLIPTLCMISIFGICAAAFQNGIHIAPDRILPKPAPADEAIVQRFVRPVAFGGILPLQTVPDHIDDAADDAAVIDPGHAMRQRKERRDQRHLTLAEQKQIIHRDLPNQKAL